MEKASNFTEEEIDNFIKMGKKLAGKAVLSYLIEVIKECSKVKVILRDGKPDDEAVTKECDRLVKLITRAIPFDYCGFTQCEFAEIDYKLNITLTLVDRGYKTDIAIPDASYAGELIKQYGFLREVAMAYWSAFIQDNGELFARAQKFCGGLNISQLITDKDNPTVLYFDAATKKQIGIFAYYVDNEGRPLRKKK